MTVETEVATLTTAVDNLTSAVNVSKATLDASVVNAQSAETGAIAASGTASGFSTAAAAHKDLAYTYSQSAASAVTYQDLTAIAASKSVTAVDVFVYDTSKDSDDGAWRKRTQGTSWYNETLNTATRGSRKEFPAVAVIVAEAAKVTIYDGDDPSMPMWMVFSGDGMLQSNGTYPKTGITALNGKIAQSANTYGISIVDFITDSGDIYWNSQVRRKSASPIAKRNTATFYIDSSLTIVHNDSNDIAMTVLPNAPIDSATGLPIPTIAIATNGGISVIKDDGTVVDITSSYAPTSRSSFVGFNGSSLIIDLGTGADRSWVHGWETIPSADTVVTVNNKAASSGTAPDTWYDVSPIHAADLQLLSTGNTEQFSAMTLIKGSGPVIGIGDGLTLLKENRTTPAHGSVAYITSDYNTAYMTGDIKLAALSDTDDTDVVGGELVTNGTFDTATTGWTARRGATLSIDTAAIKVTNADVVSSTASQAVTVVVGKTYIYSFDRVGGTRNAYARVGTTVTGGFLISTSIATGSFSRSFVATASPVYISLQVSGGSDGDFTIFDNVSVRLADTDRSVNANGLTIHGTITKNPVATGADLVAYSGFSANNYLEQPYNSDLNFGTGDFSVMGWMKWDSSGSNGAVLHRTSGDNVDDSGTSIALYSGSGGLSVRVKSTTLSAAKPAAMWTHYSLVRSSGVLTLYLDGVQSTTATSTDDIADTAAVTYVGSYYYGGNFTSSGLNLALQRISATAPSAQQIKDIYEAEKPLFQENAQATLYGTSDAVTALAHDSDTNLLHVGTSSGRSVFQGLQRVSNTTTAVGSAISASNGLVVED